MPVIISIAFMASLIYQWLFLKETVILSKCLTRYTCIRYVSNKFALKTNDRQREGLTRTLDRQRDNHIKRGLPGPLADRATITLKVANPGTWADRETITLKVAKPELGQTKRQSRLKWLIRNLGRQSDNHVKSG